MVEVTNRRRQFVYLPKRSGEVVVEFFRQRIESDKGLQHKIKILAHQDTVEEHLDDVARLFPHPEVPGEVNTFMLSYIHNLRLYLQNEKVSQPLDFEEPYNYTELSISRALYES